MQCLLPSFEARKSAAQLRRRAHLRMTMVRVAIKFVMAGLVPAIHVLFDAAKERRGCPGQARA
jgi:hypothetical protein